MWWHSHVHCMPCHMISVCHNWFLWTRCWWKLFKIFSFPVSEEGWNMNGRGKNIFFAAPESWYLKSFIIRDDVRMAAWLPSENDFQVPALQRSILVTELQPVALACIAKGFKAAFAASFSKLRFLLRFQKVQHRVLSCTSSCCYLKNSLKVIATRILQNRCRPVWVFLDVS